MKINVVHESGELETITLTEPLTLVRGEKLNRLRTATGAEHFFTEDGWYDGWGQAFSGVPADAADFIEATMRDKEIPQLPSPEKP